MKTLYPTLSHDLTLQETLERLAASDYVEGLALFGSRTVSADNPVSDYDLLILVATPPVQIFQMLTHIDRRMADIVFVDTEAAERVLTLDDPIHARSLEGLFMQKMKQAQIVYDAAGRLQRVQDYMQEHGFARLLPSSETDIYLAWFWQNHGLFHLKRMVQSDDGVYEIAVDMMLLACLAEVCRAYHTVRRIVWQGEKAAVRYLQEHDPAYLELWQACIGESNRKQKVALYEQLVMQTLTPVGDLWTDGITAVYLGGESQAGGKIDEALRFWEQITR